MLGLGANLLLVMRVAVVCGRWCLWRSRVEGGRGIVFQVCVGVCVCEIFVLLTLLQQVLLKQKTFTLCLLQIDLAFIPRVCVSSHQELLEL